MEKEKINLVKLLKDCPKGMELDCTIFDNVVFERVDLNLHNYPIVLKRVKEDINFFVTKYGQCCDSEDCKCAIFPKGKNTWEGFEPLIKYKVGDVVVSTSNNIHLISCHDKNYGGWESCCGIIYDKFDPTKTVHVIPTRLATKEEKEKLFNAIKVNGYRWDDETKTLVELPKFKVGDRIRTKKGAPTPLSNILITEVNECSYNGVIGSTTNPAYINFKYQDQYELVPDKFDVSKLKPFDRVLVRSDNKHRWQIQFFERLNTVLKDVFVCMGGYRYHQCIPFEGNEYLHDTANNCKEYFETWQKS